MDIIIALLIVGEFVIIVIALIRAGGEKSRDKSDICPVCFEIVVYKNAIETLLFCEFGYSNSHEFCYSIRPYES